MVLRLHSPRCRSAVLAVENELGTAAARNYVLKKRRGHDYRPEDVPGRRGVRSGNKAATGLVRLPNLGAVKWRKADNSGDLGMALNASTTWRWTPSSTSRRARRSARFSYPDATTTSKGIVQIDPVGGLAGGGRGGLVGGDGRGGRDVPEGHRRCQGARHGRHQCWFLATFPPTPMWPTDIVSGALPFTIQKAGAAIGTAPGVESDRGRQHYTDGCGRIPATTA